MYKDIKPKSKASMEKVEVERLTIDPRLTMIELLKKLNVCIKQNKLALVNVGFEGSLQTQKVVEKGFGKGKKLVIKQSSAGLQIPRKIIKISHKYSIRDLIEAFKELDEYLIKNVHDYSLDVYPVKLTILDKGTVPNHAMMIVKFEKRRKVAKNSEVGTLLKGAQYMPLDAVDLRKAKFDAKRGRYIKKERPNGIQEKFDLYDNQSRFVEADDIKNYTRNIYDSEFTIKTSCIVGKERKVFDRYTTLEDGSCRIVPK